MTFPVRHSERVSPRVWLTLAVLAVALKVMVPAGFMVAPRSNDLPFAVVMCTGKGAVTVQPGQAFPGESHQAPAPGDAAHDSPCAFAGHALAAPPPALSEAQARTLIVAAADAPPAPLGLAPGRGLSGPPLPARGPPSLSA